MGSEEKEGWEEGCTTLTLRTHLYVCDVHDLLLNRFTDTSLSQTCTPWRRNTSLNTSRSCRSKISMRGSGCSFAQRYVTRRRHKASRSALVSDGVHPPTRKARPLRSHV